MLYRTYGLLPNNNNVEENNKHIVEHKMTGGINSSSTRKNTPNSNIHGTEGFQRLNFLYQACLIVVKDSPNCHQHGLISTYGKHICSIGKKLQLKMDSSLKRTLCKKCKGLLVPGKTASVCIRKSPKNKKHKKKSRKTQKYQHWSCLNCHDLKSFPI